MLSKETIIRAWKDATFRESLSDGENAALPVHPSDLIRLTDEELGLVQGGRHTYSICETTGGSACTDFPPGGGVGGGGGGGTGNCCSTNPCMD